MHSHPLEVSASKIISTEKIIEKNFPQDAQLDQQSYVPQLSKR